MNESKNEQMNGAFSHIWRSHGIKKWCAAWNRELIKDGGKANKLFDCNKYANSEQDPKRVKVNMYADIVIYVNTILKSMIINSRN